MQTSYSTYFLPAFAGMLADTFSAHDYLHGKQAEVSAEIPFGVVVARGATENACELVAATNDVLVGVVMHSHVYDPYTDLGTVGLKPNTMLNVANKARIWCLTETAFTDGQRGFVRYAGTGQKGAIRNAAVTNETIDLGTKVRAVGTHNSGLAVFEVDFQN